MQILGFILIEVLLSGFGWLCLYVWYRDRKKIEKIKNEEYAGQYSAVGKVMILNFIAGLGAIITFGFVLFLLVALLYKWITIK